MRKFRTFNILEKHPNLKLNSIISGGQGKKYSKKEGRQKIAHQTAEL